MVDDVGCEPRPARLPLCGHLLGGLSQPALLLCHCVGRSDELDLLLCGVQLVGGQLGKASIINHQPKTAVTCVARVECFSQVIATAAEAAAAAAAAAAAVAVAVAAAARPLDS